jgi:prepilin-type N-terminal cleavage/methylation domain-containing protein
MKIRSQHQAGYTLIELLSAITIILVITYFGSHILSHSVDDSQFEETRIEMIAIRNALVGNPALKNSKQRSNFGYVGDLGGLPSASQGIQALLSNPGLPAFSVDLTSRMGWGWNGAYLFSENTGKNPLYDGWGNPYQYSIENNQAVILSFGADGVVGGSGMNQDLKVIIPGTQVFGKIYGLIQNQNNTWNESADVEIFFPTSGGALTSKIVHVAAGSMGYFATSEIPYGQRSLKIYIPSKTSPSSVMGPVIFIVDAPHVIIPSSHTQL